MKKLWLLLLLALGLAMYRQIPFQSADIADLLPVETIVIHAADMNYQVSCDVQLAGHGRSLVQALEDLTKSAPGNVFLATAQQIVVCGTDEVWHQLAQLKTLRPNARIYQAEYPPGAESVREFLLAHKSDVTILELRAAEMYGLELCVPRLVQEEGRYQLAEGKPV